MKVLVAHGGPQDGNAYAVGARTLIGRAAECDIQLIDKGVSRRHACALEQEDGRVLLRDLGSSNGTFVAGETIREVALQPGDKVQVGETCFVFRDVDGDSPTDEGAVIKLVSGPAQASTVVDRLADIEARALQEELARRREQEGERPTLTPASMEPDAVGTMQYCCENPLAARAHRKGWAFCPACGASLPR